MDTKLTDISSLQSTYHAANTRSFATVPKFDDMPGDSIASFFSLGAAVHFFTCS